MKGIILAGGSGTRLHPVTKGVSKQLLPLYSKPMIYYPLATLMFAGIKDILIITTPHEQNSFKQLLEDGSWCGVNITYAEQAKPEGLAQAFIIGKEFIGNDRVALVLGDNLFYGHGLPDVFRNAASQTHGATVFAYMVQDPQRYGVVTFGADGKAIDLVEKPQNPTSNYAVTGIYFYDNRVVDFAKDLKPSARGELEITDLNRIYMEINELHVEKLGRGTAWLDTGTFASLIQASTFVQSIEERQGLMVCCPEEIALSQGYITTSQLKQRADQMKNSPYGKYLSSLIR